jgi:hypothetical protein
MSRSGDSRLPTADGRRLQDQMAQMEHLELYHGQRSVNLLQSQVRV